MSTLQENIKMFMFARWISTCYADTHLDTHKKCEHDEGFNSAEAISVLNREDGAWWKNRIEHFNMVVWPNYIKNGSVKNTEEFLTGKKIKTAKISLSEIKDEGWNEVAHELGLSEETINKYFKYGEYGSFTIEINEDLNIVGGHIH